MTIKHSSEPRFPETRWSKVLAVRASDSAGEEATTALNELCRLYWYPVYAFARRSGHSAHDAEDLTQSFFERVLSREMFAKADPEKGRLRSFLLGAFKNFASEYQRDANRLKRGGGKSLLPLDEVNAEELFLAEENNAFNPELQFDRTWGQLLLRQVLIALEREYERRGQRAVFERLHGCLTSAGELGDVATHARALGMTAGAVRVAVHRLRERYRRVLEMEVRQTVASHSDAEDEIRYLAKVFAQSP